MKIKQLIIIAAILLAAKSNAQIKVFTGGSVSIGSTGSPATNNVNHQIVGSKIYFPSSTSTPTSVAMIRGNLAYSDASTPDYTWWGNDQTGFFHPANNVIGITIGNSEKFRFNSSCQLLSVNTTSSASTPDFSWNGDSNTGIYHPANDILGLVANGAERMRVTNLGNVLIGGTSDNGEKVIITGVSNQQPVSIFTSYSTDGGYGQIIWVNQHHTKAFSVISSASGSNVENFFVHGNGDAWGKSWTSWSDKSLKENIESIPNALNKLKQLKGVSYNFKASFVGATEATKKEIGLIAQDVESVIPEVVRTNDNGIKGISYNSLIPLLIEAIKEQDKQITELKNDVSTCCKPNQNRINPLNNGESNNGNINTSSYIKQNSPNPFSKETLIEFFIAEKNASSSILIFDMNGKLLKTLKLNGTGNGAVTINGNDFKPGMYYYSLIINNKEIDTKKMIFTEQ